VNSAKWFALDEPLEPFATRYFTTPMIEEEATVTAA